VNGLGKGKLIIALLVATAIPTGTATGIMGSYDASRRSTIRAGLSGRERRDRLLGRRCSQRRADLAAAGRSDVRAYRPDSPVSMAGFYAGLHPEDREATSAASAAAADPGRRALNDVRSASATSPPRSRPCLRPVGPLAPGMVEARHRVEYRNGPPVLELIPSKWKQL